MDALTLLLTGGAGGAAFLGLGAGARLVPRMIGARRSLEGLEASEPRGRQRSSSILSHWHGDIRHADGSFTRVYRARLESTMLAHDEHIERRYDQLGRMLAVKKPEGCVISFRLS